MWSCVTKETADVSVQMTQGAGHLFPNVAENPGHINLFAHTCRIPVAKEQFQECRNIGYEIVISVLNLQTLLSDFQNTKSLLAPLSVFEKTCFSSDFSLQKTSLDYLFKWRKESHMALNSPAALGKWWINVKQKLKLKRNSIFTFTLVNICNYMSVCLSVRVLDKSLLNKLTLNYFIFCLHICALNSIDKI